VKLDVLCRAACSFYNDLLFPILDPFCFGLSAAEEQKALFEKSKALTWIFSKSFDILSDVLSIPPFMLQSQHQYLVEAASKWAKHRQFTLIKRSDSTVQIAEEIWLDCIQV